MASLYIKDSETADAVARLAQRRGVTKTRAVLDAVRTAEAALDPPADKGDWLDWIRTYRAANPLPASTGRTADKAFYDAMWDEV